MEGVFVQTPSSSHSGCLSCVGAQDQPASAPGFNLQPGKRRPFASMSPRQQTGATTASEDWNYGGVQSVSGSPLLAPDNDTLLFYFGGQQGFSVSCVGPGSQTGLATLRRDGYAAMETNSSHAGVLTSEYSLVAPPHRWLVFFLSALDNC